MIEEESTPEPEPELVAKPQSPKESYTQSPEVVVVLLSLLSVYHILIFAPLNTIHPDSYFTLSVTICISDTHSCTPANDIMTLFRFLTCGNLN